MQMNPEAHFDCLLIASELETPLGGVTRLEMQRIAFLSCLLSIYTKQAASDWGYKFANTGTGLPFSGHLVSATDYLVSTSLLSEAKGRLRPTPLGSQMLAGLAALQLMAPRIPCLNAAAASLLAVPGSVMAEGLQQEPTTVASKLRDSPTMLLDEPHLRTLHDHFAALAAVFPPGQQDLLSPSVLWLTYMAHVNEAKEDDGDDPSDPGDSGDPGGSGLPGGPASPIGSGGEAMFGADSLKGAVLVNGCDVAVLSAPTDHTPNVTAAWPHDDAECATTVSERAAEAELS